MATEPEPEPLPDAVRRLRRTRTWLWLSTAFWLALLAVFVSLWRTTEHATVFTVGTAVATVGTVLILKHLPADDARRKPVRRILTAFALGFLGMQYLTFGFPVTVAVGGWVLGGLSLADGVQQLRHGPPAIGADGDDGATDPRGHEGGSGPAELADAVEELLEDRPLTRREVGERVDADGERVDAALDHLREAGRIERAGSAYRRTERGSSGWLTSPEARADGIRERVGPRLKRLAWPVSVEFDADRERDGAHQRGREGEASDRSDDDWSDAVDRSDAGQERELADGQ